MLCLAVAAAGCGAGDGDSLYGCGARVAATGDAGAVDAAVVDAPVVDAVPGAPDASFDAGALPPDAGVPAAACGTVAMLRDDFEDGVRDRKWSWDWEDSGSWHEERDGALVITVAGGAGDAWAGYMTEYLYDLRGAAVEVEVVEAGPRWTLIEVVTPPPARVSMQLYAYEGTLEAYIDGITDGGVRAEVPYDPVAHRWWRLREDAGTMYWEASPDRAAWSIVHQEPNPAPVRAVHALLMAGGSHPSDTEARFAAFNPDGDAAQGWCASATLRDDFDDGARAPEWSWAYDDSDCALAEDGALAIALDGPPGAWCEYMTGLPYDLRGSSVAVEVPAAPADPDAATYLLAQPSGSSQWIEIKREDELVLGVVTDTGYDEVGRVPYDPVAHRWWRLRDEAGTFYWETSPDGTAWTARASAPTPLDVAAVQVVVGAGTPRRLDGAAEARFDNVNVPPAP